MDTIKEYFKNKTEEITFIELKEDVRLGIKGYPLDSSIPLPIITETLVHEIKEGALKEESSKINITNFFIIGNLSWYFENSDKYCLAINVPIMIHYSR